MPEAEEMKTLVARACTLRRSTVSTSPAMDRKILDDVFQAYERSLGKESVAVIRSHLSHELVAGLEMRVIGLVESSGRALQILIGSMLAATSLIGFLCFLMVSNNISWLERFCVSFAVGILSYEVLLVARGFWKGWQRGK
ncbi:MAG: hypothetical protein JSW47_13355 [Phycisphaerales bacterium]|nr:MAG: hypothetical protein JSW47_13355 [Phycisphaerales bacterium]